MNLCDESCPGEIVYEEGNCPACYEPVETEESEGEEPMP